MTSKYASLDPVTESISGDKFATESMYLLRMRRHYGRESRENAVGPPKQPRP